MTTEKDTWTRRAEIYNLTDLSTYMSPTIKMIELTHDFGGVLRVYAQAYTPLEGDVTYYVSTDKLGNEKRIEMPCYAITRLGDTKEVIERYIDDNLSAYMDNYLDPADFLIWETFQLAVQRASWQNVSLISQFSR